MLCVGPKQNTHTYLVNFEFFFGFSLCFVVTVGMYVGRVVELLVQDSSNQPLRPPYLDDLQYLCSSLTPVRVLETPYPVL